MLWLKLWIALEWPVQKLCINGLSQGRDCTCRRCRPRGRWALLPFGADKRFDSVIGHSSSAGSLRERRAPWTWNAPGWPGLARDLLRDYAKPVRWRQTRRQLSTRSRLEVCGTSCRVLKT